MQILFSNCKRDNLLIYCYLSANIKINRPGHYLEPGVEETEGLKEILNKRLGPEDPLEWDSNIDWSVGECLSTWWRPNYENYMVSALLFLLFYGK